VSYNQLIGGLVIPDHISAQAVPYQETVIMATFIPHGVRATHLINMLTNAGLQHLNSGKTGELFALEDPNLLLIVKMDRISIFDFVLNGLVGGKGSVCTATTVLGMTEVFQTERFAGHHIAAYGKNIDKHLPRELRGNRYLQSNAIVVLRRDTPTVENIVREYLTGTGLTAYQETGKICGHVLPPGLHDGSKLPTPIPTPTTKATHGHDEHMDYLSVRESHGMYQENVSLGLFKAASGFTEVHGLILADVKWELDPTCMLIDEFSPDTCRLWLKSEWEKCQAMKPPKSPGGYDKQFAREWGKTVPTPFFDAKGASIVGIHKLDPKNQAHVAFVSTLEVPPEILAQTSQLYHQGFGMLFERTLEAFWKPLTSV
jgi:phosphoribosylaminoimidazole-succinocarboxamide synthase